MSPQLKGWCHPLSPEGKTQILASPPWQFSEDILMINFRTDPEQVRRHLPDPLEPSAEPGLGQVWLSSALAFGTGEEELIGVNPERVFYKECVISVGCRFQGREALMISYIWVDKDFTLIRGWIQGFPKRLGNIQLSFEKRHLYAMNAALGEFGDGTRVRGYIESHGERLVTGTATLGRKITPDELAAPCKRGFMQIQHFPDIELGSQRPLVNRLVDHSVDVRFGNIWEARDASLAFAESEIEELHMLRPKEITSAYLVNIGITVKGARVLHRFDSEEDSAAPAR